MTLDAAYSFGGTGSTIADDSGNGRSFTLDASTVRAAGGGLTRTASGKTLGPPVFGQTPNRSISLRIKRGSFGDAWFPEWGAGGTGVWGVIDLTGQRQARGRNASGVSAAQTPVPAAGVEQAIAATYDGTSLRLYVDGVLTATQALAGPLRTDATEFAILDGTSSDTVIKDLRIYSHTLTLAEVIADRDTPVTAASVPAVTGAVGFTLTTIATSSKAADATGTVGVTLSTSAAAVKDASLSGAVGLTLAASAESTKTAEPTGAGGFTLDVSAVAEQVPAQVAIVTGLIAFTLTATGAAGNYTPATDTTATVETPATTVATLSLVTTTSVTEPTMKRGDLEPNLVMQLTGTGADLTGVQSWRLLARLRNGSTLLIDEDATTFVVVDPTDPTKALLTRPWQAPETAEVGLLLLEAEASWPGGRPQTFPTDGTAEVRITSDLG